MKHQGRQSVPSKADIRTATFLLRLPEACEYQYKVSLTGVNLKAQEDGWLIVLKGDDITAGAVVAFVWGEDYLGCLGILEELVRHHNIDWRVDKYK